jgi:hypothetical protein
VEDLHIAVVVRGVPPFASGWAAVVRTLRVLAVSIPLVAHAGCSLGEVTAAEGGDVLVVEGHLQASPQRQTILLHRSLRNGEARGEPNAEVTITGPDGVAVALSEVPQTVCAEDVSSELSDSLIVWAACYATSSPDELVVHPGATYQLDVVSERGERVRGRTTVPGSFRGRRPLVPDSEAFPACAMAPRTNLELMWTESEGAWSYLATVEITGLSGALEGTGIDAPDRVDLTGLSISQSDTTLVIPAEFGLFELSNLDQDLLIYLQGGFPPGVTARLRISALDRNYVNAIRGGSFNPSGAVRFSSVVGDGVGVFGSYVPRDLFIVVEPRSPLPRC